MPKFKEALRDIDTLKDTLMSYKDRLSESLRKWRDETRAEEIKVCEDIKTIVDREGGKKAVFTHDNARYEASLAAETGIGSFLVSRYPKGRPEDILECKMVCVVGGENSSRNKFGCTFDTLKELRVVYDSLIEYEESVTVAQDFVVAYTQFLQSELKSDRDLVAKLLER